MVKQGLVKNRKIEIGMMRVLKKDMHVYIHICECMYVCVRIGRQRIDVRLQGTAVINEQFYLLSNVFIVAGVCRLLQMLRCTNDDYCSQ